MADVTFRDETPTGKQLTEWKLTGLPDRMTVRELIALRVREEAARHNAHPVDVARRTEAAEHAFLTNGFFVLSGDRQLEALDEVVDLAPAPTLIFIKLVALVGG
ncbi:hypothetical protein [Streptomyces flaveolus]|jgi:hypothetical protein|uniref:hypothetical protein n=1 Tax=Streptomyces flaveolus TaxID=67297 RepID=UPI00166FCC4E|nr:hypothetical protein [Streptomyces flaveolus]GGQ50575.1 hypothetical protein GCM10010216_08690 [Streptomyces flaveolus]